MSSKELGTNQADKSKDSIPDSSLSKNDHVFVLESILSNTVEAIWVIDGNYKLIFVNSTFITDIKQSFGVDISIGISLLEILPEAATLHWKERYDLAFQSMSENQYLDEYKVGNDNIYTETIIRPILKNEKVIALSCHGKNITELRMNEQKAMAESEIARKSEAYLETLINTLPDLIWLKDINGVYQHCNKRFEDFFGAPQSEILNKTDYDFVDKELADFFREHDKNAMKAGGPTLNEEEITFANDGHKEFLETIKTPLLNKANKIIGVLGVGRDITERKLYEKELLQAKEKAEESDRLKSTFLANMSHEIRTPMNAIIGFSNLLKREGLSNEQRDQYLEFINNGSKRLLRLISDILDVSKLDSNQLSIHPNQFSINNLTNGLYKEFSLLADKKSIKLICINSEDDDFNIVADENRLNQVLSNLLDNAIKFTPKGKVEFGYNLVNNKLLFHVRDTGIGIKKEYYEIIFNRFGQVDREEWSEFDGTGLGLSIAKSLIGLMNGKVWLQSKENHGSCFFFEIPFIQSL